MQRHVNTLPGRPARRSRAPLIAGLLLGGLALVTLVFFGLLFSGAFWPKSRGGGPPVAQPQAASSAPQAARAPRPTPGADVQRAVAQSDVVAAASEYIAALYAADDLTAAQYRGGYTDLLRKDENELELQNLSARAMSWGEAGYLDADPDLEWAEVVARVRSRSGATSGNVYYKLGFRREGEGVQLDMSARRMDLR